MSILFDPIRINGMEVPNRFVRSATNDRCAGALGEVSDVMVSIYDALAAGGVGLIITGHAYITSNGKANITMLGVHEDRLIPGLQRLTDAVHRYDSKVVLQINHAGRQTTAAAIGEIPVAPSAVYNPLTKETSRALTNDEIQGLIDAYGAAAQRAVSSGFDGVQIHCAHGYMGSQFISPYTNRRDDSWGGLLENRMRFPMEVYGRIRAVVGKDYPILIKLNSEDYIEGGLTIEESPQVAGALSKAGIDAIEISGGMGETHTMMIRKDISEEKDEAYFLPNAKKFKDVIDVPLILVGGLRSPGLMERLVADGEAEMVSLSRPLIREPDLVNQWKSGNWKKADCISCRGCSNSRNGATHCVLNEGER